MRTTVALLTVSGLVGGLLSLTPHRPAHAATVIPGFNDAAVASFTNPTAVEWIPDKVVVLERAGRVRIGEPGVPGFATALTVAGICAGGERGLLGFTHDPGFLGNGFVYLYYTRNEPNAPGGCVNRVSRFTLAGTTIDPASEVVLLDNISSVNGNHNGGDLDVGSDGYLYVAVGDAGRDPRGDSGSAGSNDAAQDLSLLNGKILRITRDGQPAPGNPVSGAGTAACATRGNTPSTPTTACQEIFAWGLRNPYRFAFDRNDGSDRFFINDVGQGTREEVSVGVIGGNYGWPEREGFCRQGLNPPCAPQTAGYVDPITDYGRNDGQVITGGAFVPNGLWPPAYDGAYLFGDAGSGEIWVRFANGSVDYASPFATGAGGLSDMTFGFDATGRAVLYYVQIGGGLRMIGPATTGSNARSDLRLVPIEPFRAYDTGAVGIAPIGVAGGDVFNATTRRIDLDPPAGVSAALVNLTISEVDGPGFLTVWAGRGRKPPTSSLNADRTTLVAANAAIVPLADDGSFIIEATLTGRVVVDVMAWLDQPSGAVAAGRFVALSPQRLVDTRIAAGTQLASGADNPYARAPGPDVVVSPGGRVGVPNDGTAAALLVSVAAIGDPALGGYVSGYRTGTTFAGNSNVNVVPGDVRANLLLVPISGAGEFSLRTFNVPDVVVDVLGYVTSASAPATTGGRYSSIEPTRVVDTRTGVGFGPLTALAAATVTIPGTTPAAAVVHNVTVTDTSAAGWVATFPEATTPPEVSNVNYVAAGQTRATVAITTMPANRRVSYRSLVPTHIVVDVIGTFS